MNYTVVWEPPAENDLAAAWVAATDRVAITEAAHRLDAHLARNPFGIGRPRNSSVNRTAVDLPLGVEYEVIEDDKAVRVLRVWSLF